MNPKSCRAYQGGIRVQRSEERRAVDKPRPDIVVRCGPSGGRNFITDPLVVTEILSPSPTDLDRGEKLRFYKGLPTLRHIALVYQDQMRLEHYRKTDAGWVSETLTGPDDVLSFEAVGFEIDLAHVYFGVEFASPDRLAG